MSLVKRPRKELVNISKIAKNVTKEMTPKQIQPRQQVKMFRPAAM